VSLTAFSAFPQQEMHAAGLAEQLSSSPAHSAGGLELAYHILLVNGEAHLHTFVVFSSLISKSAET